jgi:NAD(P)-dependent dehydrogenase (short-subunit alcohol dehydrogenase family)
MNERDMQGRLCLVTGATAGIGRAAALALAAKGADLVLVARNKAKGEQVIRDIAAQTPGANVQLMLADLSSQAQIRSLAAAFKAQYTHLDVLVNNAGGVFSKRELSVDGIEMTFALNHLAYFMLTNLLIDTLIASGPSRVVSVSSGAHVGGRMEFVNLQGELRYNAFGAYSRSKLANLLFTFELARRLNGTQVTANALHPGAVRSDFAMHTMSGPLRTAWGLARPFMLSPEQGAETLVYLASSPEVKTTTGGYFIKSKPAGSSARSRDEALAARLWEVSEKLTGLKTTIGAAQATV